MKPETMVALLAGAGTLGCMLAAAAMLQHKKRETQKKY